MASSKAFGRLSLGRLSIPRCRGTFQQWPGPKRSTSAVKTWSPQLALGLGVRSKSKGPRVGTTIGVVGKHDFLQSFQTKPVGSLMHRRCLRELNIKFLTTQPYFCSFPKGKIKQRPFFQGLCLLACVWESSSGCLPSLVLNMPRLYTDRYSSPKTKFFCTPQAPALVC